MIKNILRLQMLAPNSEFTTLFPQQKSTTKTVPSQKATQKTPFTFLWHACFVFLAFVFLTILISGLTLLIKPSEAPFAFVVVAPLGVLFGVLLKKQKHAPSFLEG